MSMKRTLSVLAAVAAVLCLGSPAEAQLAKRGTYTVRFWFQAHEKFYEIESGHSYVVGELRGTFFNDAGDGFLHRASGVCPGVRDIVKGFAQVHRYCVITDEDDDKAMLTYRCKGPEPCEGEGEWLGGTGKYTGLKGRPSVFAVRLGLGNRGESPGYVILRGEWQMGD